MSSRRLIFHTLFCVVSVGGVLYNTLYLRTPSEERFGWKFQFLTYINAVGINYQPIYIHIYMTFILWDEIR